MDDDETITCLLTDDHEALRKGVAQLLEAESDIRVVGQAADGHQALGLLERRRPDVLIVDVKMPDLDGIEICRRVTAAGSPVKVIVYSAFDDVDKLGEALAAGAEGYVLKSAPPGELVRAVRLVRAGKRYIDPALAGGLIEQRETRPAVILSARETEVLQLLADGMTTEAVGQHLFLSPATVRSYTENAMHKLEASNRVHAIATALRNGLVN